MSADGGRAQDRWSARAAPAWLVARVFAPPIVDIRKNVKGSQLPAHKYLRREMGDDGQWKYYYYEPQYLTGGKAGGAPAPGPRSQEVPRGEEIVLRTGKGDHRSVRVVAHGHGGVVLQFHDAKAGSYQAPQQFGAGTHAGITMVQGKPGKSGGQLVHYTPEAFNHYMAQLRADEDVRGMDERAKHFAYVMYTHVPKALLRGLPPTATLAERVEHLQKSAPKVYALLEKALRKHRVDPEDPQSTLHIDDAKRLTVSLLNRKGWSAEARGALLGAIAKGQLPDTGLGVTEHAIRLAQHAEQLARVKGQSFVDDRTLMDAMQWYKKTFPDRTQEARLRQATLDEAMNAVGSGQAVLVGEAPEEGQPDTRTQEGRTRQQEIDDANKGIGKRKGAENFRQRLPGATERGQYGPGTAAYNAALGRDSKGQLPTPQQLQQGQVAQVTPGAAAKAPTGEELAENASKPLEVKPATPLPDRSVQPTATAPMAPVGTTGAASPAAPPVTPPAAPTPQGEAPPAAPEKRKYGERKPADTRTAAEQVGIWRRQFHNQVREAHAALQDGNERKFAERVHAARTTRHLLEQMQNTFESDVPDDLEGKHFGIRQNKFDRLTQHLPHIAAHLPERFRAPVGAPVQEPSALPTAPTEAATKEQEEEGAPDEAPVGAPEVPVGAPEAPEGAPEAPEGAPEAAPEAAEAQGHLPEHYDTLLQELTKPEHQETIDELEQRAYALSQERDMSKRRLGAAVDSLGALSRIVGDEEASDEVRQDAQDEFKAALQLLEPAHAQELHGWLSSLVHGAAKKEQPSEPPAEPAKDDTPKAAPEVPVAKKGKDRKPQEAADEVRIPHPPKVTSSPEAQAHAQAVLHGLSTKYGTDRPAAEMHRISAGDLEKWKAATALVVKHATSDAISKRALSLEVAIGEELGRREQSKAAPPATPAAKPAPAPKPAGPVQGSHAKHYKEHLDKLAKFSEEAPEHFEAAAEQAQQLADSDDPHERAVGDVLTGLVAIADAKRLGDSDRAEEYATDLQSTLSKIPAAMSGKVHADALQLLSGQKEEKKPEPAEKPKSVAEKPAPKGRVKKDKTEEPEQPSTQPPAPPQHASLRDHESALPEALTPHVQRVVQMLGPDTLHRVPALGHLAHEGIEGRLDSVRHTPDRNIGGTPHAVTDFDNTLFANGEPAGFMSWQLRRSVKNAVTAHLNDIHVFAQGKGLGTGIVNDLRQKLANTGATHLTLNPTDVGRYTWPAAGFEFPPDEVHHARSVLAGALVQDHGVDELDAMRIARGLQTAKDVVRYQHEGVDVGKQLALQGVLGLNNGRIALKPGVEQHKPPQSSTIDLDLYGQRQEEAKHIKAEEELLSRADHWVMAHYQGADAHIAKAVQHFKQWGKVDPDSAYPLLRTIAKEEAKHPEGDADSRKAAAKMVKALEQGGALTPDEDRGMHSPRPVERLRAFGQWIARLGGRAAKSVAKALAVSGLLLGLATGHSVEADAQEHLSRAVAQAPRTDTVHDHVHQLFQRLFGTADQVPKDGKPSTEDVPTAAGAALLALRRRREKDRDRKATLDSLAAAHRAPQEKEKAVTAKLVEAPAPPKATGVQRMRQALASLFGKEEPTAPPEPARVEPSKPTAATEDAPAPAPTAPAPAPAEPPKKAKKPSRAEFLEQFNKETRERVAREENTRIEDAAKDLVRGTHQIVAAIHARGKGPDGATDQELLDLQDRYEQLAQMWEKYPQVARDKEALQQDMAAVQEALDKRTAPGYVPPEDVAPEEPPTETPAEPEVPEVPEETPPVQPVTQPVQAAAPPTQSVPQPAPATQPPAPNVVPAVQQPAPATPQPAPVAQPAAAGSKTPFQAALDAFVAQEQASREAGTWQPDDSYVDRIRAFARDNAHLLDSAALKEQYRKRSEAATRAAQTRKQGGAPITAAPTPQPDPKRVPLTMSPEQYKQSEKAAREKIGALLQTATPELASSAHLAEIKQALARLDEHIRKYPQQATVTPQELHGLRLDIQRAEALRQKGLEPVKVASDGDMNTAYAQAEKAVQNVQGLSSDELVHHARQIGRALDWAQQNRRMQAAGDLRQMHQVLKAEQERRLKEKGKPAAAPTPPPATTSAPAAAPAPKAPPAAPATSAPAAAAELTPEQHAENLRAMQAQQPLPHKVPPAAPTKPALAAVPAPKAPPPPVTSAVPPVPAEQAALDASAQQYEGLFDRLDQHAAGKDVDDLKSWTDAELDARRRHLEGITQHSYHEHPENENAGDVEREEKALKKELARRKKAPGAASKSTYDPSALHSAWQQAHSDPLNRARTAEQVQQLKAAHEAKGGVVRQLPGTNIHAFSHLNDPQTWSLLHSAGVKLDDAFGEDLFQGDGDSSYVMGHTTPATLKGVKATDLDIMNRDSVDEWKRKGMLEKGRVALSDHVPKGPLATKEALKGPALALAEQSGGEVPLKPATDVAPQSSVETLDEEEIKLLQDLREHGEDVDTWPEDAFRRVLQYWHQLDDGHKAGKEAGPLGTLLRKKAAVEEETRLETSRRDTSGRGMTIPQVLNTEWQGNSQYQGRQVVPPVLPPLSVSAEHYTDRGYFKNDASDAFVPAVRAVLHAYADQEPAIRGILENGHLAHVSVSSLLRQEYKSGASAAVPIGHRRMLVNDQKAMKVLSTPGILLHELGHVLQLQLHEDKWTQAHWKAPERKAASAYGATHPSESFAEAFALLTGGSAEQRQAFREHAPEQAKDVQEILDHWAARASPAKVYEAVENAEDEALSSSGAVSEPVAESPKERTERIDAMLSTLGPRQHSEIAADGKPGRVVFGPDGAGGVSYEDDVVYGGRPPRGHGLVYMRPSQFLELAKHVDEGSEKEGTTKHFLKQLQEGQTVHLGSPFLSVHRTAEDVHQVTGHEGRHRVRAIQQHFGDSVHIPVVLRGAEKDSVPLSVQLHEMEEQGGLLDEDGQNKVRLSSAGRVWQQQGGLGGPTQWKDAFAQHVEKDPTFREDRAWRRAPTQAKEQIKRLRRQMQDEEFSVARRKAEELRDVQVQHGILSPQVAQERLDAWLREAAEEEEAAQQIAERRAAARGPDKAQYETDDLMTLLGLD